MMKEAVERKSGGGSREGRLSRVEAAWTGMRRGAWGLCGAGRGGSGGGLLGESVCGDVGRGYEDQAKVGQG